MSSSLHDAQTITELGERLWKGEEGGSPVSFTAALLNSTEEFCGGEILFVNSLANVLAVDCGEGGVVLIDSGSMVLCQLVYGLVKQWREEKGKGNVGNVIWTHHHIDHVFGVNHYEEEGPVTVYSHKNTPGHFHRYRYTQGYNAHINGRQFQTPVPFPSEYRFPNVTYDENLTLNIGNQTFHLHHGMGETDDATWVWIPKLKAVATGDLFIWCCPNCGNPAKAQRYCKEWADALRKMMNYEPEYLFPGHGPPIWGKDRVALALKETAELLETIEKQAVNLMNEGKSLDEVIQQVEIPKKLLTRPYLRAVYDDPEFILRNIWRRYGGWFDSFPPSLQPPSHPYLAKKISELVEGGPEGLAKRAEELAMKEGEGGENLRVARYFADWAEMAVGGEREGERVHEARMEVYRRSAEREESLMAKGVYNSAVVESQEKMEAKL